MKVLWKSTGYTFTMLLLVALVFSSGVCSVLLYGKLTGKGWRFFAPVQAIAFAEKEIVPVPPVATPLPSAAPVKSSAMLEAPLIQQFPELPSGCEVTSLAMMLQYAGINKDKMSLASEMKRDPTRYRRNSSSSIIFWGNPNTGFVGEVNGKDLGYGIYHSPLFELLKKYIPAADDLTGKPFADLERRVAEDIPVLVWTTKSYTVPDDWTQWDSPAGPVTATFSEHAVLLVGFDPNSVYINDPKAAMSKVKVDKKQFIAAWEAMGKQSLSYHSSAKKQG
jgi:uncharacterized protein YvpB